MGPENHSVEEMLEHAAAGDGACISPHSMTTHYARPGLRWLLRHDAPPLRIDLAWNPRDTPASGRAFIAHADTPMVEQQAT